MRLPLAILIAITLVSRLSTPAHAADATKRSDARDAASASTRTPKEIRLDQFIHPRIATDVTHVTHIRAQNSDDPFDEPDINSSDLLAREISTVKLISAVTINNTNLSATTLANWQKLGVFIETGSSNQCTLNKGNVLVMPGKTITVATHEGTVKIAAGSVALIMENGNDVSIYDLHDGRKGGIAVFCQQTKIPLLPGKQLLLTKKINAAFPQVNPSPQIAYRNPSTHEVYKDTLAFAADFSILSALVDVKPLLLILDSNNPKEKRLTNRLIKNAVVLASINSQAFTTDDK